tara:strand:+ start:3684 stop:6326 length:2643 start_codon:yes stop_codon:yes gene_type:complete
MTIIDSFKTKKNIQIDSKNYIFFDLNALASKFSLDLNKVPVTLKILLENLLRHEDGITINKELISDFCSNLSFSNKKLETFFYPTRVLMQDFTGVPAIADLAAMREALSNKKIDPKFINPFSQVDLIIDHSVMVDSFGHSDSFNENKKKEFERNKERYEFLKWGQKTFNNLNVVPPGAGICHQVNLENISKTIWVEQKDNESFIFPDSVVGTDSHTTMVNSLSVLGWGVGGIEAEASMLGEPISLIVPQVVGFEFIGSLKEGITATDLVLTVTEKLRKHGVVGKFVEFFGSGLKNLTLADRATISNMAPEYGATCGFFPTDKETIEYLKLTGKSEHHLKIIYEYTKKQNLWSNNNKTFSELIAFDLGDVQTTIAGPKRPQDKIYLQNVPQSFQNISLATTNKKSSKEELINGDIVLAAITSCTNTSNPNVMVAAGLVAKKAVEAGLNIKPWVKTSLAPGSKVVSDYLNSSGLTDYLDQIGFNLVGYGCTTCIGNSGPLNSNISEQIKKKELLVCSVLSGNRNFEGRIHQEIKANYLASPPLVVIYALAGNINVNLTKDPIAYNIKGEPIFLKDLWPSSDEIKEILLEHINKEMFIDRYKEIYDGDVNWSNININSDPIFKWNVSSTYIKSPPFFLTDESKESSDIIDARVLLMLGDSITTDHISPAGSIQEDSPAGIYLKSRQVVKKDFNSYGSRRGNHEIMMRGTFANIRIKNEILPETEGGITKCFVSDDKKTSVYDAAKEYLNKNIPLIIIAGKEYGTGSSRDWAAKGTKLLGVRAVIAESFERIHRSNLIGMGILPLEFVNNQSRKSLNIKGDEKFTIQDIDFIKPNKIIECKIENKTLKKNISLHCRIDTQKELEYFRAGGILRYILASIEKKAA